MDQDCEFLVATPEPMLTDKIRLVKKTEDSQCGVTERASVDSFQVGTEGSAVGIRNVTDRFGDITKEQGVLFQLGLPKYGGTYQICFCMHVGDCGDDINFYQLAGNLVVGGVEEGNTELVHQVY